MDKPSCHALLSLDDIRALHKILPPKQGELLRMWMLRCTSLGLIKKDEALQVKENNPKGWDAPCMQN